MDGIQASFCISYLPLIFLPTVWNCLLGLYKSEPEPTLAQAVLPHPREWNVFEHVLLDCLRFTSKEVLSNTMHSLKASTEDSWYYKHSSKHVAYFISFHFHDCLRDLRRHRKKVGCPQVAPIQAVQGANAVGHHSKSTARKICHTFCLWHGNSPYDFPNQIYNIKKEKADILALFLLFSTSVRI